MQASQHQSRLENELAASRLRLKRLASSEAAQQRRIQELAETVERQAMILRSHTPALLPNEQTTAVDVAADVLARQRQLVQLQQVRRTATLLQRGVSRRGLAAGRTTTAARVVDESEQDELERE